MSGSRLDDLSAPPAERADPRAKVGLVLVVVAMLGVAAGFWLTNGGRVFNALISGALSLCF